MLLATDAMDQLQSVITVPQTMNLQVQDKPALSVLLASSVLKETLPVLLVMLLVMNVLVQQLSVFSAQLTTNQLQETLVLPVLMETLLLRETTPVLLVMCLAMDALERQQTV